MVAPVKTITNVPEAAITIFCNSFPLFHWSIFSSFQPSMDAGKIRVNVQFFVHILGVFRCDISKSQAGSFKCFFFCQNRHFTASEEG